MATVLRKTHPLATFLANAVNSLKIQIGAGALFHLDRTEKVPTSATATDLPTALLRCNDLIGVYRFHGADLLAHAAVEAAAMPAQGAAVDLATAITAANLIRTSHGTHIANTGAHANADATNTIAASAASDLSSLLTLLNEIHTDMAAHMLSGPSAPSIRLVSA